MDIKKAAALKYDKQKDKAPKLIAKGSGLIAEKIIEIARKNDIEIYSDSLLIELLYKLEIGENIPQELYKSVAEIFAYVYKIKKQKMK